MTLPEPLADRARAALVTAFGEPTEVLDRTGYETLQSSLTDHQQSRLTSAVEGEFAVFPLSPGMYRVYSEKPDGQLEEYWVCLADTSTCECGDYLFNCDPSKGQRCKHLWRVQLLIKLGALPDPDYNPYKWLRKELYLDVRQVDASSRLRDHHAQQFRDLHWRVSQSSLRDVDFVQVYRERAEALVEVLRAGFGHHFANLPTADD